MRKEQEELMAKDGKYQIGMIGLGVMGRNLALNMGDHDFAVVGYDKDQEMVRQLNANIGERKVLGIKTLAEFINSLSVPRNIMLMVPARAGLRITIIQSSIQGGDPQLALAVRQDLLDGLAAQIQRHLRLTY